MDGRRRAHLRILVASAIVVLIAPAATTAQPVVTVLHAFAGGTDGKYPGYASLIQATDGNFCGTTERGGGVFNCYASGVVDCGTVNNGVKAQWK